MQLHGGIMGVVVRRIALLAVAAFLAAAPLCSAALAASPAPGPGSGHATHTMAAAQATTILTGTAMHDGRGPHCAPHSCCAASLAKTPRAGASVAIAMTAGTTSTAIDPSAAAEPASALEVAACPQATPSPAPLRL